MKVIGQNLATILSSVDTIHLDATVTPTMHRHHSVVKKNTYSYHNYTQSDSEDVLHRKAHFLKLGTESRNTY